MSNKALILSAVRACPGIGVAELAEQLGMQRPNARRDALQLRDKGLVTVRECEAGYVFFPVGEEGRARPGMAGLDPDMT